MNVKKKNKDEDSRFFFFSYFVLFVVYLSLDFASSFCGSFMIYFYN